MDLRPVVTFTDLYTHFKVNREHSTFNLTERTFEEGLYKHSLSNLIDIKIAKAYYKRYNRTGISFNLGFIQDGGKHDGDWGLIKNHFYHKVNEINPSGVTKLSSTSDKLPLYPLIGEIAIDKKDINVFRSSWDSDYYTRSLAGGISTSIPGTLDTHEERSYLASTVMKPKYSYDLLDFNTSYVTSEEELDDILRNNANTSNVVVYENKNYIIADFYITDTLITRLAKDGVLESISRYVSPDLLSSIATIPSRPTFSRAVAIKLPISSSLLPEIVATALICASSLMSRAKFLSSSIINFTPLSIPFFTSIGLEP